MCRVSKQNIWVLLLGVAFAAIGFAGAYVHLKQPAIPKMFAFSRFTASTLLLESTNASNNSTDQTQNAQKSGLVTDEKEQPLEGVTVHFFYPGENSPTFSSRSNTQGHFDLPSLTPPGGFWRVTLTRNGYFGAETLWDDTESELTVRMQKVAGLHVEVITASGQPAAGARIRLVGVDISPSEWTTESNGGVFLDNLPSGIFALQAIWENQAAHIEGVELDAGQTAYVHLYLEEGIIIKGFVRDEKDDTPIAGALFSMAKEEPSLLTHAVFTDENGKFTLGPLPADNYRFSLAAEGYVPLAARRFWVGKTSGLALFELTRGITITGRILDTAGRPIQGAHVDAWGMDASGQWIAPVALTAPGLLPVGQLGVTTSNFELGRTAGDRSLTNDKGEYQLSGVSPGYLWIAVHHEDFISAGHVLGEVTDDYEAPDIRLTPGGEMTLVIRDEKNFAVAGAMVRIEASFGMEEGRTFITNDQGEVRITGMGSNQYASIFHPDFPVHIEKLSTKSLQIIQLSRGKQAFSIRLRDARLLPVIFAQVELAAQNRPERRTASTDKNGQVRFDGVPDGAYEISVIHPNYPEFRQKDIQPGDYDWILPYGGGFSAFVRDRQTLEGLAAQVILFSSDQRRIVQETKKGEVTFLSLSAGTWRVHVQAQGYVPLYTEVMVQEANALMENNGSPQLWEMDRAGSISGIVRDAAGFVVRKAIVVAGNQVSITDRNGRFSIQGLPAGEIEVTAWHPRVGMGGERVHVLTDLEAPEIIVDLVAWSSLTSKQGTLGVQLERDPSTGELRVKDVQAGSSANKAGLKRGDVVWQIDGLSSALPLFFLETRLYAPVGTVTFWRVGPQEELSVPLFLRFE